MFESLECHEQCHEMPWNAMKCHEMPWASLIFAGTLRYHEAIIVGHRSQLELAAVGLAISLANVTGDSEMQFLGILKEGEWSFSK